MTEQFGKYRLERKLAVGGMAEIFLATHQGPEGFQKHVAIKRILPHLTEDQDFVTMFLDEARLVARFNHPNIVQIFELGEVDGQYFLSMEFVHGVSMSKLLKAARKQARPLPLEYGAKVVSHACEGLEYAHSFSDADGTSLNLIHRDVSPQNLMLSYDGVVKVLDFGIAKAAGNIYQTRTSSLKGKAAYMSPEQITQKTGLDRRSDIFSLGIVLFEFATGKRPFGGDTELELMMSIVKKNAPDPRALEQTIPVELAAVIGRALHKDRQQRYQNCRELRQDLEELLLGRRLLVDNYTLGAFAREVIPPGDAGVGYSVPTPSRPPEAEPTTTPSPRSEPRAPAAAGADAPTVMTPSEQLRPVLEQQQAAAVPAAGRESGPAPGAAAPEAAAPEPAAPAPQRRRPWTGMLLVLLLMAIGAGTGVLIFGDGWLAGGGGQSDSSPVAGASIEQPPGGSPPAAAGDGEPATGAAGDEAPAAADEVSEPEGEPEEPGSPQQEATAAEEQAPARPGNAAQSSATRQPEADAGQRSANERRAKKRVKRRRRRTGVGRGRRPRTRPEPKPEPKPRSAGDRVAAAAKPGFLVIDTRPWTNVQIDGAVYGATPLGPVELQPGMHEVVLANKAKGIRLTRSMRILPGQTQRLQEKFGRGLLQVFVKPFGEVFVNGVRRGMTPLDGPIKLYEGRHAVQVICKRTGKRQTRRVRIRPGATRKLIFDLR